ncbi:MAG: DNA replication and repair protein RecF [Ignavibacteria bacterium]|nr:DNA replication and repair protein RecF [Ignavibacteria bacterium]MBI3766739.1 DNA replication and repair protein RecF [Ignavibacteriales bacterium]
MHLTTLKLHHFRNHLDSWFDFGDGINVLSGDNGQGKTNVIEAISYLCLTKSFYAGTDSVALNFDHEVFEVEGTLMSDHHSEHRVRVAYAAPTGQKVFSINRRHVEPFSSVVGKFPIVICSPEHTPITSEGPSERRRFVDFVISQSSSIYFQNLMEYRKVLKHRNKILLDGKILRRDVGALLDPWDEQLISHGSSLLLRRKQFVEEFEGYILSAYHQLIGSEEEPAIEYRPMNNIEQYSTEKDIREIFRADLSEKKAEEMRFGTSLIGPHRDEFVLKINGLDLRKFASQGQHKTFLVALKIGEFFYLKDRCNETPILLLDDVFSELDEHRSGHLLKFVETLSQAFVTSTNPHLLENSLVSSERNKVVHIHKGTVVENRTFAV